MSLKGLWKFVHESLFSLFSLRFSFFSLLFLLLTFLLLRAYYMMITSCKEMEWDRKVVCIFLLVQKDGKRKERESVISLSCLFFSPAFSLFSTALYDHVLHAFIFTKKVKNGGPGVCHILSASFFAYYAHLSFSSNLFFLFEWGRRYKSCSRTCGGHIGSGLMRKPVAAFERSRWLWCGAAVGRSGFYKIL